MFVRPRLVVLSVLTGLCASLLVTLEVADRQLADQHVDIIQGTGNTGTGTPGTALDDSRNDDIRNDDNRNDDNRNGDNRNDDGGSATGPDRDGFDPVAPLRDTIFWGRENQALMIQNRLRQGWGPELPSQVTASTGSAAGQDSDVIRVVVAGDSFVLGQGVEDLDMRWPTVLERQLNALGGAKFEVIPLARMPSSTMQIADWLSPERVAALRPDIVVFGYLRNDFFPTFEESRLCRIYGTCVADGQTPETWNPKNVPLVACLNGMDSLLGSVLRNLINPRYPHLGRWLTNRYCDPDRVNNREPALSEGIWLEEPAKNPHWSVFTESMRRLARNLDGVPVVVYDYDNTMSMYPGHAPVKDVFEANGFRVVPAANAAQLFFDVRAAGVDISSLWINPADQHPGSRLTAAYAADVAPALYETLGIAPSSTASTYNPGRSLVSNFLPATMHLERDGDAFVFEGGPLSDSFVRDNFFDWAKQGDERNVMETSCATMGRPHARVMFDRYLPSGSRVDVTLLDAEDAMVLVPVGYRADGTEQMGAPILVRPGSSTVVELGPVTSGFLLGTRHAGCPDERIRLPYLKLRVEKI